MGKEKTVPALRFPGFEGEWVTSRASDLFTITAGGDIPQENVSPVKTSSHPYPIYANAIKSNGLYGYSNIYRNEPNTITVAGRGVNVGIAHARDHRFYPIVRLLVLIPKDDLSPIFFEYCINNYATIIESTGVPQLTAPQFSMYKLKHPASEEQQKIASFLSSVDDKIEQLQKKKELLEQYKKGVMQKIFKQELRFRDEDGKEFPEWEEKELGDLLSYEQPTKYIVHNTEYDRTFNTPVLTAGKSFILGYTNETFGVFKNLPVIIFDDFTTASKFVDFPFKVKSSAMKILLPREGTNIKYVYEAMQNIEYEIGGHGRHWISAFSKILMPTPVQQEQTKIAKFLSSIDDKITLVNKELDQTKQFKKGLLQQMFV